MAINRLYLRSSFCLFSVFFFQSCSSINEGEIDYVKTVNLKHDAENTCSTSQYRASMYKQKSKSRNCYETLYRKYVDSPPIEEGDTVSLHLMQGYIVGSNESRTPYEFFSGSSANAEVVVIASVCEQGVEGCSLEYGQSSDAKGRVVYFSDGVKAKQYLNFSYLPVYGPIKYQGGPIIVRLAILELDEISDKQVALLRTLAQQGEKAYPPASPVLSVLDTLGSSLLQGKGEDVSFRFTMTFTPDSGVTDFHHPTLSPGNYAFIRKDTVAKYQEHEVWTDLKFDNFTGRIVAACSQQDKAKNVVYPVTEKKGEGQFSVTSLYICRYVLVLMLMLQTAIKTIEKIPI